MTLSLPPFTKAVSWLIGINTGVYLLVLLLGLLRPPVVRERMVPLLTLITLGVTLAFEIAHFKHRASFISGALRFDDLALVLDMVFVVAATAAVALSTRIPAVREAGHGEYHSLLLFSVLGMESAPMPSSVSSLTRKLVNPPLVSLPTEMPCVP